MAEAIDKKHLAGLKFTGKVKGKDGEKESVKTRALTPADVLDWTENGNIVTIVTADGQKYTVDKTKPGKAATEEKAE